MPIQKQLSVFLPNRPGMLARISSILAEADVNILALSVHDTVDNAVVRLVLDNPTKALLLLEQEELYIMEQNVVILAVDNQPGTLARIAQKLSHADINIQYAYCTAARSQVAGCIVLKTDETEATMECLREFESN
ncbi:MAG: hypothetical protein A3C35_05475 [Omnitrophica bacterium RIFCSPHIGHO2_02_FULL_46_11]|nr:MAG: hypothetical protein A3C35_05475 [Omnitrophica bacterium RIFCSPHIGHO2_02_FULL_46_11]OGW87963.1 MAG: hypothetical protein A3A81_06640 [Omnitrophica bacterium RIFCSPLOWO2_01_FULL_45_10b]